MHYTQNIGNYTTLLDLSNALSRVTQAIFAFLKSSLLSWIYTTPFSRSRTQGTPSPMWLRGLGEGVVRLGCDWSANDFHTQRRHGAGSQTGLSRLKNVAPPSLLAVNCFQHPQPSEYYKFKRVNRIRPTRPSVCPCRSRSSIICALVVRACFLPVCLSGHRCHRDRFEWFEWRSCGK